MTIEKHTASCMCGNITLEATGPAHYTEYCHCKWCQQSSGSAFISWVVFDDDKVKVTKGQLSHYQSGAKSKRGFCRDCGSTISFQFPGNFDIALGVMDNPEPFEACKHIWNKSRIKHINITDDLPKFNQGDV